MLDLLGAIVGIAVTTPLLAGCAIGIKIVHGGPVVYRQWRVGRDGWLFRIYKLRTMRLDAEALGDARFTDTNDPRILAGCGWIRKTHIDELPQLWNILIGDMSLVGPRPERPEIFERLREDLPSIERRLATKPGLTGLAQVCNGYTNDLAGARRKLALDLRYLRSRGLLTDLRLMIATMPKIWDQTAL
ncbi:MAG: sugar transferase [Phycisphaeraceae bacterium]|nr:sugar transferase [Phycisphaeraceae bacterium]